MGAICDFSGTTAAATGVTADVPVTIALVADTDYTYDTESATEPYSVSVTDAEGWTIGVKLYLDTTWKILIPGQAVNQTATVKIIRKV